MLRISSHRNASGLGQMPPSRTSGSLQIAFSPVIVNNQAECAQKSGQLFDDARLCCIKRDLSAPGEAAKLGWYCAYTSFGAPRQAGFFDSINTSSYPGSYPGSSTQQPYGPNSSLQASVVGSNSSALALAGILGTLLYFGLRKKK